MNLDHIRTENGTRTLITTRDAVAEIESAMIGPTRKEVRQMSASRSGANIEYRDGRKVDIRPATPAELDTIARESAATSADPELMVYDKPARIVTVNGKRYVVSSVMYSSTATSSAYVDYWSERNGRPFGPTRWAGIEHAGKRGTVGAAIWAAVQ